LTQLEEESLMNQKINLKRRLVNRFQNPFRTPPPDLASFSKYFLKGKTAASTQQVKTVADQLHGLDPLADAWVAYAYKNLSKQDAKMWVSEALTHGIDHLVDPPSVLHDLFIQIEQEPLWLDAELLSLARQTFRRSGFIGHWVLTQVALMGGYRYEGVIQPLVMTGRLTDYASKRMADTTQFINEVMSLNGLYHGGKGRSAAVHVRLLHAYIRYHLKHHKDWLAHEWGSPINQSDMIGTQLLFSISFLVTSRLMGMRYTEREAHSVIHLWRYVGHLMGLDPTLVPATEDEALRTFYLIGMTQSLAGEEASHLAQALHQIPLLRAKGKGRLHTLKAHIKMKWGAGISQMFLGDEGMHHLKIPTTRMKYIIYSMIPAIFAYETIRSKIPKATQLSSVIGGSWQDWHLTQIMETKESLYHKATPHSVKVSS
jgi:hypothetical protein